MAPDSAACEGASPHDLEVARAHALFHHWARARAQRRERAASNLEQARAIHGRGVEVEDAGVEGSAAGCHHAALQAEKGWACKVRRPHSVKKEKGMVQVKEGYFRVIVAKAGNKLEQIEFSPMNVLGASLESDAFHAQAVKVWLLTSPSTRNPETAVSTLEMFELSEFREAEAASACMDAVQALASTVCPLGNRGGVLAIVNPTSGHKKGMEIFKRTAPLFRLARVNLTSVFTRYGGHARDIIKGNPAADPPILPLDVEQFPTLVIIGGDGTVCEVLNALMERPDWRSVVRFLRVGTIPAGSECALGKMIGFINPIAATYVLLKGHQVRPVDVLRITQGPKIMHSICGVGWGMPGKMAQESETMREAWGPARYLVSGLKSFVNLKGCRGTLHILRAEETEKRGTEHLRCLFAQPCSVCQMGQLRAMEWMAGAGEAGETLAPLPSTNWEVVDGNFVLVGILKSGRGVVPFVHLSDGCLEVVALRMQSRMDLLKQSKKILDQGMDSYLRQSAAAATAASSPSATPTPDRNSSGSVAGSFTNNYPSSQPSPTGSSASRVSSSGTSKSASSSKTTGGDPLLYWKARAVRLIPHDVADAINVDGEVLPGRAIEVRVLPALLKVLAAHQPDPSSLF